jgi:hypothetical protein
MAGGKLKLEDGDTGNYVGFEAPDSSSGVIWKLPAADGSAGQVLKTDGNKVLSWADTADYFETELAASITHSSNISETTLMSFGSLDIGGEYEITAIISFYSLSGLGNDMSWAFGIKHNGSYFVTDWTRPANSTFAQYKTLPMVKKFTATASTIDITYDFGAAGGGSGTIMGTDFSSSNLPNGTSGVGVTKTYATLKKFNNY